MQICESLLCGLAFIQKMVSQFGVLSQDEKQTYTNFWLKHFSFCYIFRCFEKFGSVINVSGSYDCLVRHNSIIFRVNFDIEPVSFRLKSITLESTMHLQTGWQLFLCKMSYPLFCLNVITPLLLAAHWHILTSGFAVVTSTHFLWCLYLVLPPPSVLFIAACHTMYLPNFAMRCFIPSHQPLTLIKF